MHERICKQKLKIYKQSLLNQIVVDKCFNCNLYLDEK